MRPIALVCFLAITGLFGKSVEAQRMGTRAPSRELANPMRESHGVQTDVYSCSNCEKEIDRRASSCPYCGVGFSNALNSSRSGSSSGSLESRGLSGSSRRGLGKIIGFVIFGLIALGGLVFKLVSGNGDSPGGGKSSRPTAGKKPSGNVRKGPPPSGPFGAANTKIR